MEDDGPLSYKVRGKQMSVSDNFFVNSGDEDGDEDFGYQD
jgi:hypothetical protein